MKSTKRIQVVTVMLAVATGSAAIGGGAPVERPKTAADEAVVAAIGDVRITASQFEKAIGNRLLNLRTEEYEAKRQILEEMIGEMLLERAARSRGIPVEELLREQVEAKATSVPEDETRGIYQLMKRQYPKMPESRLMAEIRAAGGTLQMRARRADFVKELWARSAVRVFIDPPRVAVDAGNAPSKGAKDAPVTIVEFSDFECQYCARAARTIPPLEKRYGEKLRFVFRHYPLPGHQQAPKAAEAALCAHEQGRFWEMHDRLFMRQGRLQVADLKRHAVDLGLDAEQFDLCLDSGKHEAGWKKDLEDGTSYGVSSTPAFFINGRLISGARRYDDFARIIDDELQRAGVPVPPPPAVAATDAAKGAAGAQKQ